MRKLLLIIALATMTVVANAQTVVANAQNKTNSAKVAQEMVYYYTTFNIVRVKNAADGKEIFVPFLGSNTGGKMKECRNSDNKIICFETTTNGFNYITSLGWELWWHDDHYNAIQRWVIRKKIPKQDLKKYMEEDMILTDSIESIPSAVEELQRLVK